VSETLRDFWQAALLADAAYSRGLTGGISPQTISVELRRYFPESLGSFLAEQNSFAVLDQYSAGILNGFSATVFSLGGTNYFALRGSNDLADILFADILGIAGQGIAREQAVEMYRYWRRLTTPENQPVAYTQAELKYMAGVLLPTLNPVTVLLAASSLISAAVQDRGLGVLPANAQVVVTGHSLGGHLGQLFYEMFPMAVSHVYTFNGAGVGGVAFDLAAGDSGSF